MRHYLMSRTTKKAGIIAAFCLLFAQNIFAQAPTKGPVSFNFDGGIAIQSGTDLSDAEGGFSVNRWFASMGVTYAWDQRNSIGLSVGGGSSTYDFDALTGIGGGTPWEEIDETRISLVGRMGIGETGTLFLIPSARYNGEKDANTSDGRTYGMFAAAAWRMNENLTIGPGVGVFSKLDNGTRIFPILVIDWKISERWYLSTSRGLAASQGPGLTLGYQLNKAWSFGLTSRYENQQFRLAENGTTPGGIGKDESIPVVASAAWQPNKTVKLALFGGFEFAGKLKLRNAADELVSESKYDPAPIFGATFELNF
jgi:hypothetical protein